ncbi:MAG: beta-galactosidase [Clostridiales bacterium]|nr:beta-galactosidase [Clostridiales bacterium]
MDRTALFPNLNGILHGGDYNPDQWLDRPDILKKDIELMKKAKINCVTLGVFSWSVYEPVEGEFHFEWLENIIDNLYDNDIYTILATPSGARPAWLDEKYPDSLRVDAYGHRFHHGVRHNHCMSSENFRNKVKIINTKLAEKFANHPAIILWHISNEFGGYCYCDTCKKKFQNYLAKKFNHDINKLNKAWWTNFWSHTYGSFDQIEPPYANGETSILGLNLEWKRFTTFNMTEYMKFEINILRTISKNIPITTNFMKLYEDLDYYQMAKELDIISWDSYPQFHNDKESLEDTFFDNGFNHALFRSMKPNKPFMLMESAPGVVNWNAVNKYRRPGIHKLASMQAIAMGADTVQYFQIRKGRGGFEQFHGAVIDHLGTDDTRIFKEVSEVGDILNKISEVAGSVADNKVAVLFDWDNRWAVDDVKALAQETKNYDNTCIKMWQAFVKLGVDPDVISSDADWSRYKIIIAPMLYLLHDGEAEKIKKFVSEGGQILATYFTGYVDHNLLCYLNGFPGDGLKEVFGIISEEIDSFYPTDRNHILLKGYDNSIEVYDYAELLRVDTADILGIYEEDYIKGTPAVTKNQYGKGNAYYLACRVNPEELKPLFVRMLQDANIEIKHIPDGVEYHTRYGDRTKYEFYSNITDNAIMIDNVKGMELVTRTKIENEFLLNGKQVIVVKSEM